MTGNKNEIVISSDLVNLDLIEEFVREIFNFHHLGYDLLSRVMVCLNEAVLNSISHGNHFESGKTVVIQSYFCKKFLYFRIIDEGTGFDFNNIPDPTNEENLCKEAGRGIFIIRKVSDGIFYRNKGNTVEFRININGDD